MTERDLDQIQSRSEFQAWVPAPKPQPIDPEDDVPMGDEVNNWAGQGCIQPDTGERAYDPPLEGRGWPGDGSGMDDLADYNQMEAYDYGPDDY